jgi:CIC family chloride channel protein
LRRAAALLHRAHEGLRQSEHLYMVLVALVIGILAGLCAVGFRHLIDALSILAWHATPEVQEGGGWLAYLVALPWWWKILAPAAGGLVAGLIVHHLAHEAKGHGVPEVMEAVALRGGRIRPRVVLAKLFASAACIASGGSAGREGPVVQIGAALGSSVGQWLRLDPRRLRTLVGCGAAAGIAGTFNAPVAGALFAVEVILGDFGVARFSPIVISSVAATVVSRHYLGNYPAFQVPAYTLVHPTELFAYAGLGLLAGVVAVMFVRTLYFLEDLFDRLRSYPPLTTMLGGALLGTAGIWLPHVYGDGYDAISQALHGQLAGRMMLLLVVAKILAVSTTIGSGGSGGVFAPSLFVGAMLGGAVGQLMEVLWPGATGGAGAFALVGMGAVVAAGTHAPITAILIIFEMTSDYKIILPLMISCIIATLLASQIQRASIYTMKLLRRGVDLHKGRAINVLEHVKVREHLREDLVSVGPGDRLLTLISRFVDHPGTTIFVVDAEHHLLGLITADEIRPLLKDPEALSTLIIAQDIMARDEYPEVSPDDSLALVMRTLGTYRGEIPVLEEDRTLVGGIWLSDVIERYNTEIVKRDMAHSMADVVSQDGPPRPVQAAGGASVAEVPVPSWFVGCTIGELGIRQNYGVTVLMIRQQAPDGEQILEAAPQAGYVFQADDLLLVLGTDDRIQALRAGNLSHP